MRRRLDIALALIGSPDVVVLDEPTTGLDPISRETLWAQVRALTTQGVTVLLTTQYLEEADRLADRVGILDAGRLVIEGAPSALKDQFSAGTLDEVFLAATGASRPSGSPDLTVVGT